VSQDAGYRMQDTGCKMQVRGIGERSVQALLDELAEGTATPGGGTAAALAGAMGAALLGMVCRLTIGRPRFADVELELRAALDEAEHLRARLLELADADREAFDAVMAAYRLPRKTAQECEVRRAAIQKAMKEATRVPLATARACAAVIRLAHRVIPKVNPNAVGDGRVAALLAKAGLQGAQLNVTLNLTQIADSEFVKVSEEELKQITAGLNDG